MRILFTFAGGRGHFDPLVPVARAAVDRGHTVAVSGGPGMAFVVASLGFTMLPSGRSAEGPPERRPLLPLDSDREDGDLREGFARRLGGERAAALIDLCGEWRPDVVVRDEADFGATIAAERLAIPCVNGLVMASGSFVRRHVVAEPLHELRAAHGLPPDPTLAMLDGALTVSPFPPSFREPTFPLPAGTVSYRSGAAPVAVAHARPAVYFTLGTIFNVESGDLMPRVLAGLRDLPVDVVVTVGRGIDPAELGTQPAHIRIEQFVPQAELLPAMDLVISHGGGGSLMGALGHGLPQVLIPMGADQPHNAARAEQLGLARVLDPIAAQPADVAEAVAAVLADPSYRRRAEAMGDEIAALPDATAAVDAIERLV